MAPKLPGFGMQAGVRVLAVMTMLSAMACSGSSPEGTTGNSGAGSAAGGAASTTGTGGSSTGGGASSTGSGTTTGVAVPHTGLSFDAGATTFGPIAIGAGGGEGELFFSEATADGGYAFFLQHLTPAGVASQGPVSLAAGTPFGLPQVAVTSDGSEVTCCWEDYGGINGSNTKGEVVRCNTVPSRGTAPDLSLQGGFSDVGNKPSLSHGSSLTAIAYTQLQDEFMTEATLNVGTPQPNNLQGNFPIQDWQVIPKEGSFDVFLSDGSTLFHVPWDHELEGDGGVVSTAFASTGSFAVATTSGLGEGDLEVLLTHQGAQVAAEIYGLRVPPTATINGTDETPVDPLAAVTCSSGLFGVAYALSDGRVVFRTIDLTAAVGPEHILSTGFDAPIIGLSMTVIGDTALIAASTSTGIQVFTVPCS